MNILHNLPVEQLTKTIEEYPLSLNAIKRHLRLDNDFVDDDAYLMELLKVACQYTEGFLNKAITKTKNVLRLDDYTGDYIQIFEGNFLSLDPSNSFASVVKQTSVHYDYFTIEFNGSISGYPLYVTFYTGFEPESCPELIKQAVLIKISDLYDNSRSSLIYSGLTDSKVFETLLQSYQSYRF